MTEPRDLPLKLAKEFLNLRQKYGTVIGRADWDIFQDVLNDAIGELTKGSLPNVSTPTGRKDEPILPG